VRRGDAKTANSEPRSTDRSPALRPTSSSNAQPRSAVVDAGSRFSRRSATSCSALVRDQPPRAIAQRLHIPVATVHPRQRATHQLRHALDRDPRPRALAARVPPLPSALPTLPALPALPALVMSLGILAMNTKLLAAVAAVVVGSAAVWIGMRSPATAPQSALDTPAPLATSAAERSALSKTATGERIAVAESAPAAPPAPAAGSRQIAGRVVDADGRPSPGVNVKVGDQRVAADDGRVRAVSAVEGMLLARADEPGVHRARWRRARRCDTAGSSSCTSRAARWPRARRGRPAGCRSHAAGRGLPTCAAVCASQRRCQRTGGRHALSRGRRLRARRRCRSRRRAVGQRAGLAHRRPLPDRDE
jgi:hypothetical protein